MKTDKRFWVTLALVVAVAGSLGFNLGYLFTQRPELSLNAQQFGVIMLRGRYRSWFLSFSDGKAMDERGRWRSVVINEKAGTMRYGYRIIPRYSHVDMANFPKDHK